MRRLLRSGLTVLFAAQLSLVAVTPALALHAPPPDRATQVHDAALAGAAWLLSQQDNNTGCWGGGDRVGHTALAMLAIMHTEPGGYPAQNASTRAAIDKGTSCILGFVHTATGSDKGTITDGDHRTYNTSIAIWALSDVPATVHVTAAITGGRTWLHDNQCNQAPVGRADSGGYLDNGGWHYEGGCGDGFVEHSNSSFALQGLEASGGIPAATASLAQGFWTCLQRVAANENSASCSRGGGPYDGGFIYSHEFNKGGTQTSATGSGSFALSLTGVAASDPRISAALAFLNASLNHDPCDNLLHRGTDLTADWFATDTLIHYGDWADLKAHELAGVADNLNDTSNWFYKLANCLTNEQRTTGDSAGSFPASFREDDDLATSFALLTLEKVTPEKQIVATGKTITSKEGQSFSGAVATFTDADANATASEYTASIDWGDDHTSAGTVSGPTGGPFSVSGTHTYADEKTYSVKVMITDTDNAANGATASSTANVGDAAVTSQCAMPANRPKAYTGPVASLSDASSTGTLNDFSATIHWGDGSSSAGTIAGGPGTTTYTVSGSHTYGSSGTFTVTTTITDVGGSTSTATCPGVTQLPLTGGAEPGASVLPGILLLISLPLLGGAFLGVFALWRRRLV